jgi:hypothetical protein
VLYASGGTEAEAQAVGKHLVKVHFFEPGREASVEVLRDRGRHVVAFVMQDRVFTDRALQTTIHGVASYLSSNVFASEPVDLWLVDGELEPHVKLTWETRPQP